MVSFLTQSHARQVEKSNLQNEKAGLEKHIALLHDKVSDLKKLNREILDVNSQLRKSLRGLYLYMASKSLT